jgi:bifunctional non-homologous end joining protein LigD
MMITRSTSHVVNRTKRQKSSASSPPARQHPTTASSGLRIDGREIPVSNLNKVFYPKTGFTKGQVIDYYIRIAPVLLPHLKDRPLTLKRFPNGVEGEFFYEKRCPHYRPEWVTTASVWSEYKQESLNMCVANGLPTLVWAANLADLELHTYLAKANNMQSPTMVVFDLDPGPPAGILQCADVAFCLKELLDKLHLESFAKTSGSKGLQVYVPLNTPTTYEITKPFAKTLAELLQQQNPNAVVSKMDKGLRKGKVFVDWSQNDDHKTTVCAYSLRAKERPTVSTPVSWDEVRMALKRKDAKKLSFESDDVLERVEKRGDLFAPVLDLKQKLPPNC